VRVRFSTSRPRTQYSGGDDGMFHVWPRREELQPITFFSSTTMTPSSRELPRQSENADHIDASPYSLFCDSHSLPAASARCFFYDEVPPFLLCLFSSLLSRPYIRGSYPTCVALCRGVQLQDHGCTRVLTSTQGNGQERAVAI
jgi:hypothetical protein